MAKINRFNGNVQAFGSQAQGTERTVFGDTTQSDTLDANITADFLRGWGIVGVNENPTKQDFNGLAFTLGQLIAYLHQMGVPEWNASQEYFAGSVVTTEAGIYQLKPSGDGTVDPDSDDGTNWERTDISALSSSDAGEGSDLVAYTGTAETVTEALDRQQTEIDALESTQINYASPEQFGAVGDNIADDIVAVQAAIDTGFPVLFSPGKTYYCSTPPDFSAGVSVQGFGSTIRVGNGQHVTGNINLLSAGGVTITGTTIETDVVSGISVTGTSGNWSVTGTVIDGTKFSVGDIVRIKNTTPGAIAPGTYPSTRPVRGEMRLGFFQMGSITTSGTTVTVSGSGVLTLIAADDLVLIKGQVKRVLSVTNDTTFVLENGLANDVTNLQYWYYCDNVPVGTVTQANNDETVSFSNASFADNLNVGDLLLMADLGIRRVVSINAGALTATLSSKVPNSGPGKLWGKLTFGEVHDGAWEVTAVSGNVITWLNKSSYQVPGNNITSIDVDCYKTNLEFASDGASVNNGQLNFASISLKGSGAGSGLNLRSESASGKFSRVTATTDFCVSGFEYGLRANLRSSFFGEEAQICGNTVRGVDTTEGGDAWLQKATVNGNTGIGILVGPGSYVRFADGRCNGNSTDGMRMEVGGATWSDFSYFIGNGQNGLLAVGGVKFHHVGARICGNSDDGIDGQNGGYGRASGALIVGNGGSGLRTTSGQLEANQSTLSGNGVTGATISAMTCNLLESGIAGNSGFGVRCLNTARAVVTDANITFEDVGLRSENESVIFGTNTGFTQNVQDCFVQSGGKISLESASALPTANVALNTQTATFAYVADY